MARITQPTTADYISASGRAVMTAVWLKVKGCLAKPADPGSDVTFRSWGSSAAVDRTDAGRPYGTVVKRP